MLSVLLHVGGAAALVALSTADWAQRPLFVDLVERVESAAGPAAGAAGGGAAVPSRGARAASGVGPAPARAPRVAAVVAAQPAAAASAPAPPAVPAEPAVPVEPPTPIAMSSTPTLTPRPLATPPSAPAAPPLPGDVPPAAAARAPSPASAPGRGGAPEPGAGARQGGETRGDASGPLGGAGVSPLALALPGGGGAVPAEYGPYLQRFRRRVQETLVYPLAARRQGLSGTVELDVLLEAAGRIRDVRVVRSSSHALLDEAAVETVRRLELMPFPESLPRRPLLIRLPLVFELR